MSVAASIGTRNQEVIIAPSAAVHRSALEPLPQESTARLADCACATRSRRAIPAFASPSRSLWTRATSTARRSTCPEIQGRGVVAALARPTVTGPGASSRPDAARENGDTGAGTAARKGHRRPQDRFKCTSQDDKAVASQDTVGLASRRLSEAAVFRRLCDNLLRGSQAEPTCTTACYGFAPKSLRLMASQNPPMARSARCVQLPWCTSHRRSGSLSEGFIHST